MKSNQSRINTQTRKFLYVEPEMKPVVLCSFDLFLFLKTMQKSFAGIHIHTPHHWNDLLLRLLEQDCLNFHPSGCFFVLWHLHISSGFHNRLRHFQQNDTQCIKLSRCPGSILTLIKSISSAAVVQPVFPLRGRQLSHCRSLLVSSEATSAPSTVPTLELSHQ